MISLVLVSHSRPLAKALVDLARQVASSEVKIAYSGGAGEEHLEFGTDAIEISEAIMSVDNPDGVLVLMDLGSAILSAEMAVELLPEDVKARVAFCAGPLVEGTIAAAVQAGLGSDLQTSCSEAQKALQPKMEQLGVAEPSTVGFAPASVHTEGALQATLTLINQHGLHARPAARFVQTAGKFDAMIEVSNLTNHKGPVSAKSLNGIASLGANREHQILITASGLEAQRALTALQEIVAAGFGELDVEAEPESTVTAVQVETPPGAEQAIPIAEGIAIGPLKQYKLPPPPVSTVPTTDPKSEIVRLEDAMKQVRSAILERYRQTEKALGAEEAAIFEAHQLILDDPALMEQVHELVYQQHFNAGAAWNTAIQETAEQFNAIDDEYFRQRAADVLDVGNQVLYALAGNLSALTIELDKPIILIAEELTPTQTASLDLSQILGVVTLIGGPTSHSAILARSLGIPAITGAPAQVTKLPDDTLLALDGFRGTYWIEPEENVQQKLAQRRDEWLKQRAKLLKASHAPAVTQDGHQVEIVANAGNLQDAQAAMENGAEGIGLLRTEFLFLTRREPPDEEDQYHAMHDIGLTMQNLPVIVRTLDVGGDKELPYIDLPEEANPFLGVRAIRLSLLRPDLFRTQLRAILRAGADTNLRIMFPMVSSLPEVAKARQMLEAAHQELAKEGIPHAWPIQTGIMVEVPSAAVLAPALAEAVDFFSIGTNDLTQYTLAAERGNPNLPDMADALHPAVLTLIQQVAQAAHDKGKWVGICGELAGDAAAAPVLVGLGIDELSMTPASIPRVKAVIRSLKLSEAKSLASKVLKTTDAPEARKLATDFGAKLKV